MYLIEKLTVWSWLFCVYFKVKHSPNQGMLVYYVDATKGGLYISRVMANICHLSVVRFDFDFFDTRNAQGDFLWWDMVFEDLGSLQRDLCQYPVLNKAMSKLNNDDPLRFFLMRTVLYLDASPFILMQILILIRLLSTKSSEDQELFLMVGSLDRPWLAQVALWAKKKNVNLVLIPLLNRKDISLSPMVIALRKFVKKAMFAWIEFQKNFESKQRQNVTADSNNGPRMAVEYYGHLNLNNPAFISDVFFLNDKPGLMKNSLVYYQHPGLPASERDYLEMKQHGLDAVVLNPRATTTNKIPLFSYEGQARERGKIKSIILPEAGNDVSKELVEQIEEYFKQKDYWEHFFRKHNIKLHVSWYKSELRHFPMADALRSLGGVSVIYQRSFEAQPNPWSVTTADVVFGFSKMGAHINKDHQSSIPYYVVTGYLGDCRFAHVKKDADTVRQRLLNSGAEKIIAFFDEGSVDDPRWNVGHKVTQHNYDFLLNKVLTNPKLGLVLKPKISSSLRRRLGNVARALDDAVRTGRCYIYDEGHFFGSNAPAIAALSADVAIHGHLFTATAGIESALTKTPTLLLDREGCSKSPLYRLGEGKVVFRNWEALWQTCQEHWKKPSGILGFGDWAAMLDDLDPFRDGLAARRMGDYLDCILQSMRKGMSKQSALEHAALQYVGRWGKDKIISVNSFVHEGKH